MIANRSGSGPVALLSLEKLLAGAAMLLASPDDRMMPALRPKLELTVVKEPLPACAVLTATPLYLMLLTETPPPNRTSCTNCVGVRLELTFNWACIKPTDMKHKLEKMTRTFMTGWKRWAR